MSLAPEASRLAYPEIVKLIQAQHPKEGMQTASACACGISRGGPAATPACREFLNLIEVLKKVKR